MLWRCTAPIIDVIPEMMEFTVLMFCPLPIFVVGSDFNHTLSIVFEYLAVYLGFGGCDLESGSFILFRKVHLGGDGLSQSICSL